MVLRKMLKNKHFSSFSVLKVSYQGTENNHITRRTFVLTPTDWLRMTSN